MAIGPVEYLILSFPENKFTGRIAPTIANLVENGTVRVLDLVFISKDADGNILSFEFDQLDELSAFAEIDADVGGVATPQDIDHVAALLEPNSSAALLIWEDLWAAPLAEALREAGGVVIEGARIPHELVEAALGEFRVRRLTSARFEVRRTETGT